MTKILCKALRFGMNDLHPEHNVPNYELLALEFDDLMGAMELLREYLGQIPPSNPERISQKKLKIKQYMKYAERVGTLLRELPGEVHERVRAVLNTVFGDSSPLSDKFIQNLIDAVVEHRVEVIRVLHEVARDPRVPISVQADLDQLLHAWGCDSINHIGDEIYRERLKTVGAQGTYAISPPEQVAQAALHQKHGAVPQALRCHFAGCENRAVYGGNCEEHVGPKPLSCRVCGAPAMDNATVCARHV